VKGEAMNRRAFLGWMAGTAALAAIGPLVSPLEVFPAPASIVVELPPYWVLEIQAWERHLAQWQRIPVGGGVVQKRRGCPALADVRPT
jgi:hypothetical protein